MKRKSH